MGNSTVVTLSDCAVGVNTLEKTALQLDNEIFELELKISQLGKLKKQKETQRDSLLQTAEAIISYQRQSFASQIERTYCARI